MTTVVRRLATDEHEVLARLARDEADFDVAGRSQARAPSPPAAARAFLDDTNVLFWVAEHDGDIAGFLSCQLVRRRADAPELLLYEIGVRAAQRRQGVGRALVDVMTACRLLPCLRLHDSRRPGDLHDAILSCTHGPATGSAPHRNLDF